VRKASIFTCLTIILVVLIIIGGIPFLIRLATFLGDIKSSTKIVEKEDTTPPLPPKLQPLPEATNQDKVTVKGFSEPGSTVKIFLNDESEKELIAEADGGFATEISGLTLGKNFIIAKAFDKAGNESKDSEVIPIEYDTTPPELEITSPADESSFSGEENKIEIIGQTEPDLDLKIDSRLIILDQEGNFSHLVTLSEGENTVLIEAEDAAGNKTEKRLTLDYSP
jgi:hypothetical protein